MAGTPALRTCVQLTFTLTLTLTLVARASSDHAAAAAASVLCNERSGVLLDWSKCACLCPSCGADGSLASLPNDPRVHHLLVRKSERESQHGKRETEREREKDAVRRAARESVQEALSALPLAVQYCKISKIKTRWRGNARECI